MKLVILYHPSSEFSTMVENFAIECSSHTSKVVDSLSLETLEGANLAKLYDIVDYPSILIIREDGQLVKHWQGSNLPLIDEVIGNLNA